jgi:hypothetical protein
MVADLEGAFGCVERWLRDAGGVGVVALGAAAA